MLAARNAPCLVLLLLLLPSPLTKQRVAGQNVASRAGKVDLASAVGGGSPLRFAADGSIVHVQSFYVDALCGDDHADGRTARTAFATVDAAHAAVRDATGKTSTVFLRTGQAHRMAPREPTDPLAEWPERVFQPWLPEYSAKEKLDERGCPFNEEIWVSLATTPGSTAVRGTLLSSGSAALRCRLLELVITCCLCAQVGEVRLAGWDLSVQGKVARKSVLLLYIFLHEVPPNVAHTVVVSARGTHHSSDKPPCSTIHE